MQKSKYLLSKKAQIDLKIIAHFTIEKFGVEQSQKYANGLQAILQSLATNPEIGRRYVAVKNKMLLRYRYKAHVIFYHLIDNGIFVVIVLGGKMDFLKYLYQLGINAKPDVIK